MNLNKERNKKLLCVIVVSIILLAVTIFLDFIVDDEYIVGWLYAMCQTLFAFAVFRFKAIKELQRKSNVIQIIVILTFGIGIAVTLIGVLIPNLNGVSEVISRIGNFIAGLGINSLICHLANQSDFIEAEENKQQKKEKRKQKKRA